MSGHSPSNTHAVLAFPALLLLGLASAAPAAVHLTDVADGVSGQLFGTSVHELEDLNGDGRWELLVGAPGADVGGTDAGAVFLWRGGRYLLTAPDRVWRGQPREEFGFAVAAIGDVNDDGRPDWAVGAPARGLSTSLAGRVYVFYGGSTLPTAPDLTFNGVADEDWFGFSVAAAGDFDGDGSDDFIIGAPGRSLGATDNGAAYVIYGRSGGPSTDLADATVLRGSFAGDNFGWSVCGAGSFLGGNAEAIAVGAPDNNTRGADAGAVYVYRGTLGGAAPDTTIDHWISTSYNNAAGGRYGFAVRNAGSWDGDSEDDLAIGAPEMNAGGAANGRVEVVFGGLNPDHAGNRYVNGANAGDRLGWSLARVHDVTGSSAEDLLIGAPQRDFEASNAGRAYIFAGGQASQTSAADLDVSANIPLMPGTEADDQFGWAVSSAGDFDGDGLWDLAVGAPFGNVASNATAGFCLVVDASGQVVANLLSRWRADWTAEGDVRLDFGLAVPADQVVRLQLLRRGAEGDVVVYDGGSDPGQGALARTADGFTVLDLGAPAGAGFGYELSVTLADGTTSVLAALDGPRGLAPGLPADLVLGDIWPNPANPMVSIRFRADGGQPVACRIYDLRGRLVRTLHAATATGDWQTVQWDGRTDQGQASPSGSYLVLLQSEQGARARQLTLAR